MKDEIKEINIPENVLVALGDLTNGALNYYKATEPVKVRHNTILDCITNLQEENESLKVKLENKLTPNELVSMLNQELVRQNKNYKSRNEKSNKTTKRSRLL